MFSSDEVLAFIKDEGIAFVDIRFCDLPGVMQHFNVPAQSRRRTSSPPADVSTGPDPRLQAIHESDMKLIPDVGTAFVDPFRREDHVMNFAIVDPSPTSRTAATRAMSR